MNINNESASIRRRLFSDACYASFASSSYDWKQFQGEVHVSVKRNVRKFLQTRRDDHTLRLTKCSYSVKSSSVLRNKRHAFRSSFTSTRASVNRAVISFTASVVSRISPRRKRTNETFRALRIPWLSDLRTRSCCTFCAWQTATKNY